jgi:hypothetical protein
MPWTELIDAHTGKRTRFFLRAPGELTRTTSVDVGDNWRGSPSHVGVVFGVRWNRSRYGAASWQERKFHSRCDAKKVAKTLRRKGYREIEIVRYDTGRHEVEEAIT